MSGRRRAARPPRSGRLRAVLAIGMVLGLSSVGTAASWTDTAQVTGVTFTSGTLDLLVNDANSITSSTMAMADMIPGATAADTLRVKNAGTVPFTYTITGGLTGTDAGTLGSVGALKVTVLSGGSRSGSGNTATCSGGTALATDVGLTSSTGATIVGTAQGPLAAGAQGSVLCFQISFASAAANSLQGKVAAAAFTVTGSS